MPRAVFNLRFPEMAIGVWAARYDETNDDSKVLEIGAAARFSTRPEFLTIGLWKSSRPRKRCERNSSEYVREVTAAALGSRDPRFKIEVLRLLDGVDWPTASVVLHFCDRDAWPIIDFRAFWSLRQPAPAGRYSYTLWDAYTEYTRTLAARAAVDMRSLDRALWAYSRENQRAGR